MSEDNKVESTPTPTPVPAKEEADLQERIERFNKEIGPLLGKYELGLAAIPKIVQGGTLSADPVIISVRGKEDQLKQQSKPAEKPEEKITDPSA